MCFIVSSCFIDFLFAIQWTDAHLQSLRSPRMSSRTDTMYASLQVLGGFLIHMNQFYSVFMVLAGLVPALWWWCYNSITADKSPVQLMYATFSGTAVRKVLYGESGERIKRATEGNWLIMVQKIEDKQWEERKRQERLVLLHLICIPFRYLAAETVCPGLYT